MALVMGCSSEGAQSPMSGSRPEAADRPCAGMDGLDNYDEVSTGTFEMNGNPDTLGIKRDMRVSGDGYHEVRTFNVDDGEGRTEFMRVAGVVYFSASAYNGRLKQEWQVIESAPVGIPSPLLALGETPMCPDVRNLRFRGDEELDGVITTVYESGDSSGVEREAIEKLGSSFEGERRAIKDTFWVDGDGLLIQHEVETYYLYSRNGVRQTGEDYTLTKFSGIGEPNTITAPVVP